MVKSQLECVGKHDAHIVPNGTRNWSYIHMTMWLLLQMGGGLSPYRRFSFAPMLIQKKISREGTVKYILHTYLVSIVLAKIGEKEVESLIGCHPTFGA